MISGSNPIVAIIDSGIGGISVLKQLITKYNSGNFIYYADNLYMPYGNKTKKWLEKHILNIISELKTKFNVKQIIIACNTASTCLNKDYQENVIYMKFKKDLTYFATKLTKSNKPDINIISDCNLAKLIENNILDEQKLNKIVMRHVKLHQLNKLEEFVLGCTHYELVNPLFKKFCPNTKIINNSSFMIDEIEINQNSDELNVVVITSKKDQSIENKIYQLLKTK